MPKTDSVGCEETIAGCHCRELEASRHLWRWRNSECKGSKIVRGLIDFSLVKHRAPRANCVVAVPRRPTEGECALKYFLIGKGKKHDGFDLQ
jgi:hypothetical protein